MSNYQQFVDVIYQTLSTAPPANDIVPGRFIRFPVPEGARNKNGYCKLFDDGTGGVYGDFSSGHKGSWQERKQYTSEEREAWLRNVAAAQQKAAEKRRFQSGRAAQQSKKIFEQAPEASPDHAYLQQKGIQPHGAREHNGKLLLPIYNKTGMTSLQYIDKDGTKMFHPGGELSGGGFLIGKIGPVIVIAEGFATAASIHEAAELPVISCFTAGNLMSVALQVRATWPDAHIIIAADDDRFNKDGSERTPNLNIGVVKATEVVKQVNGILTIPSFPEPRKKEQGTDFNDLFKLEGPIAVARCFALALGRITVATVAAASVAKTNKQAEIETATDVATVAAVTVANDLKSSPNQSVAVAAEPLPLLRARPTNAPFPVEALPSISQAAVRIVHDVVQAPLDLVCQSFLAAMTLSVQPFADVFIDGRNMPLSNNFIAIGISGERKSAVDRLATGPIRAFQRQLGQDYHAHQQAYEAAHAAWDYQRKAAFKETDRCVIEALLSEAGDEPVHVQPFILCTEPSFPGIERSFSDGRYTLGLFSDEGGRFLGGYAMGKDHKTHTITGLSKLWDGDPIDRVRSGDGVSILYGRRFSMNVMIQPVLTAQLFGDSLLAGQGFLSRCLCCWPESTVGTRSYKAIDLSLHPALLNYENAMQEILTSPLPLNEQPKMGLNPRQLTLSADARRAWTAFHDHIETQQKPGNDLHTIIGFASKAAEHALRIAGVLTLFTDIAATVINNDAMQSSIAVTNFYLGESLRLFHSAGDNPQLALAQEVFDYGITRCGGTIGLRDLYRNGPNRVRSKEQSMQIIRILEHHNRAVKLEHGALINGHNNRDAWRLIELTALNSD